MDVSYQLKTHTMSSNQLTLVRHEQDENSIKFVNSDYSQQFIGEIQLMEKYQNENQRTHWTIARTNDVQ